MGRVELDPDDPDAEQYIQELTLKAERLGSNVVVLNYPGEMTRIYYGTNHPHQTTGELPR